VKQRILSVLAGTVLAFTGAAVIAPVADAQIMYKCQKWNWFIGWRTVYTTDWRWYTGNGWTCYCINQYP